MKKPIALFVLVVVCCKLACAQFAPQVGVLGSTAIHKDSAVFVNWAVACSVKKGLQHCADTSLGYALVGDSSYVPGKAGNGIVSLGDGGSATVTFQHPIRNGVGFDFAVFENGFIDQTLKPGTAFLELAFVEVSSDGLRFVRFPAVSNTDTSTQMQSFDGLDASKLNNLAGKYLANYGTPFDLEELKDSQGVDLNAITHVRIIDVIGSLDARYQTRDSEGKVINEPWPTPFAQSGFDLDAVGVIHQNTLVGINDLTLVNTLTIYPNPVKQGEVVSLAHQADALSIYTTLGQQVWQSTQPNSTVFTVSLPQGYYVIKATCGQQHFTTKLVVW